MFLLIWKLDPARVGGSDRLHETEANGDVSEMQSFFSLEQFNFKEGRLQAKL